jgi:hypothetical protein
MSCQSVFIRPKNPNMTLLILRIEESAEGGGRILRINSYSTVTLLAKFLGLSTSNPLKTPM